MTFIVIKYHIISLCIGIQKVHDIASFAKEMAYPRFRDKLHPQELRRYTLSLGMQRDSLVKFLKPAINKEGDAYFSISSLYELLDNKTANQVILSMMLFI